MSDRKDRAFRGWVADATAKDRAFSGWVIGQAAADINGVIDVSLGAPTCVMSATVSAAVTRTVHHLPLYLLPKVIEASISVSIPAPTTEMHATVIDYNYLSAVAEIDADVAEVLMMEAIHV